VSKRRHDLIEIIPPGPGAGKQARRVRDRLISQVEERRNPRTNATVDQLLERYLNQFDGTASTLTLSVRWTRTSLTRSTQPCVDAGTIARDGLSFSTAPPSTIVATTGAVRTAAGHWVRPPSGTCISSCPVPTSAWCAGSGSWTARCARPSLLPHQCRTRTPPAAGPAHARRAHVARRRGCGLRSACRGDPRPVPGGADSGCPRRAGIPVHADPARRRLTARLWAERRVSGWSSPNTRR
jgi:hypothetical protein